MERRPNVLFMLADDPGEENDLMETELTVAWVIRAAMAPLIDLQKSAARYPHVEVGADFEGHD